MNLLFSFCKNSLMCVDKFSHFPHTLQQAPSSKHLNQHNHFNQSMHACFTVSISPNQDTHSHTLCPTSQHTQSIKSMHDPQYQFHSHMMLVALYTEHRHSAEACLTSFYCKAGVGGKTHLQRSKSGHLKIGG